MRSRTATKGFDGKQSAVVCEKYEVQLQSRVSFLFRRRGCWRYRRNVQLTLVSPAIPKILSSIFARSNELLLFLLVL
jgi:hypothetical protein